jgi:muramoyltetrapeptide carboxypeptidase
MKMETILPVAPRPGAGVALVAASGPVPDGGVERAIERVESLGWTPLVAPGARLRKGYLAGSDADRLRDLQAAIDATDNDLIWLLRGGYGMMRLLPSLDLTPLRDRPRPIIGFSDVTALHLATRRLGLVTFHGPHAATSEVPDFALSSLHSALEPRAVGVLPFPEEGLQRGVTVTGGTVDGPLVGGNLALLAATIGTPYRVDAEDSILFIEEVGEAAYRVDRLLTQLALAGVFERVAGVALGAFSERPDLGTPGYVDSLEIIGEHLGALGVPVVAELPFGHIPHSWTLPEGVRARLDASAGTLELLEPAVVS